MPDAYLHQRTARAAAARCGFVPECPAAFASGANGPDPLFAYELWSHRPLFSGDTLGHRLHELHTGQLLCVMARLARTPAQRSFAAGFATHAALDQTLHPYVLWQAAQEGAPFGTPGGHCRLEAAMDTFFYRYDTGRRFAVPKADELSPPLPADQFAEQCALLRDTAGVMLGKKADILELSDSYHRFHLGRRFFHSPFKIKHLLARLADAVLRSPGGCVGHMQPAALPAQLPVFARSGGPVFAPGDLMPEAEKKAAELLRILSAYWAGELSAKALSLRLSDKSPMSGHGAAFSE